jgi:ParB/RepB/Spo0J family partition protein
MSLPARNDGPPTSRLSSLASRLATATAKPISAMIKTHLIDRNPNQPRQVFNEESIDELAATVELHGIIEPLVVKPLDAGRFLLIAGERRLRAAIKAKLPEVPCVLRPDMSEAAALAIALIENLNREDMVPKDEVTAVARLIDQVGAKEAARLLGKTMAWLSKRKAIAESAVALELAQSGKTTDVEALYELAKLAKADEAGAREIAATPLEELREKGEGLRDKIKAAGRALKGDVEGSEDDEGDDEVSHAKASKTPGAGGDRTQSSKAAPRDATTVIVDAEKRKNRLVLITQDGDEIICGWKGEARAKTMKILKGL